MSLLMMLSLTTSTAFAQYPTRESDSVNVRIETDSPTVELFRIAGESVANVMTNQGGAMVGITHIQRECRTPCHARILEPSAEFFISGEGVTPSGRFSLLGHGEDVTLRVTPGSRALRALGWTATVLGISAATVGGTLLLLDKLNTDSGPSIGTDDRSLTSPAWLTLIGGGALIGAGIPLIAFSGTDVEFFPETAPAAARQRNQL